MRTFFTVEGGDSEFANFTPPTLEACLEARSQNVSCCSCCRMPQIAFFFSSHELTIFWSAKKRHKDWCQMKLLPSLRVLCTPYNHEPCHVISFKATFVGCMRVAVTFLPQFWQNGRYLSRATAITRRWIRNRNNSQHRKLTLQKKFPPPLLPGLVPATVRSRSRRCNH